ncbi:hypothetical protein DL93DRAFT_2095088 [Clavulina sp. PMI_390]|nr:hypothetical protein DL93DRAFT_2095088 [Clavulina sp. PMI_390]
MASPSPSSRLYRISSASSSSQAAAAAPVASSSKARPELMITMPSGFAPSFYKPQYRSAVTPSSSSMLPPPPPPQQDQTQMSAGTRSRRYTAPSSSAPRRPSFSTFATLQPEMSSSYSSSHGGVPAPFPSRRLVPASMRHNPSYATPEQLAHDMAMAPDAMAASSSAGSFYQPPRRPPPPPMSSRSFSGRQASEDIFDDELQEIDEDEDDNEDDIERDTPRLESNQTISAPRFHSRGRTSSRRYVASAPNAPPLRSSSQLGPASIAADLALPSPFAILSHQHQKTAAASASTGRGRVIDWVADVQAQARSPAPPMQQYQFPSSSAAASMSGAAALRKSSSASATHTKSPHHHHHHRARRDTSGTSASLSTSIGLLSHSRSAPAPPVMTAAHPSYVSSPSPSDAVAFQWERVRAHHGQQQPSTATTEAARANQRAQEALLYGQPSSSALTTTTTNTTSTTESRMNESFRFFEEQKASHSSLGEDLFEESDYGKTTEEAVSGATSSGSGAKTLSPPAKWALAAAASAAALASARAEDLVPRKRGRFTLRAGRSSYDSDSDSESESGSEGSYDETEEDNNDEGEALGPQHQIYSMEDLLAVHRTPARRPRAACSAQFTPSPLVQHHVLAPVPEATSSSLGSKFSDSEDDSAAAAEEEEDEDDDFWQARGRAPRSSVPAF